MTRRSRIPFDSSGEKVRSARLARLPAAAIPTAVATLLLWAGTTGSGAAQELDRRISEAPDGWVRLAFEARPGVCGDGEEIWIRDEHRSRGGRECEEGPVRLELRVRSGRVQRFDARVGGTPGARGEPVTDLGMAPPEAAATWLLELAVVAEEEIGEEAAFAATLARGVEVWPDLLRIARDDDVPKGTRSSAVFWLGQEAAEAATAGLSSIIEDEGELEIREHAVFALSQRPEPAAVAALIRVARSNPEPELRKHAIFWLGQRAEDPRVLDLFEELLIGGR